MLPNYSIAVLQTFPMRQTSVLFILMLFSLKGLSQERLQSKKAFSVGLGLSLAVPARNLATNTLGGGLDVLAQYRFCGNLIATADVGATALAARFNIPTTVVVPIRLGLRYFPATNVYALGKAGIGIFTLGNVVSENYAAWSLGGGYLINRRLDVAVAYEGFAKKSTDFGYVSLRLGYTFGK